MASTLKYLIDKQPNFVKKVAYKIIPFKYRYGIEYLEYLNFLKKSKSWSYDQSLNYQLQKLKEMIRYCNDNVPYYRDIFKNVDFDPNIKDFSDLKLIPILTKDLIIENFEKLISTGFKQKTYKMNTSGTSGKRLTLLGTDDLFKIECAFITNAYNEHGANLYDDHSIWIRRYSPQDGDPIFYDDIELNRTYMSAFHLNDDTVFSYVEYINSRKSKILVSYPSTIYYLSVLCLKYDLKLKYVKYIHGASEVCLPQWRDRILEAFKIPIKMHYGQVEKVSFAHQDSEDGNYRENLLYGFNEYTDNNTIIGTGFYNKCMPLLRYKTEDIVELIDDPILDGSQPKKIKEILGRNGDMLLSDKNSFVPAVNFYSFMSKYDQVDLFQIIQKKESKDVYFYVLPNNKFCYETENLLRKEIEYRLGNVKLHIIKIDGLNKN